MKHTTEVQNAFRARFPDRDPPHKATILRNELRQQPDFVRRLNTSGAVRAMLKQGSRELNFVSSEMEGMSKDMALDKFNSRWNYKINCK